MKIAEKLLNMAPYIPLAGTYPVRLDANESPYPMPDALREKIAALVMEGPMNRYPDSDAARLRAAVADFYGVPPDCILAGNGSDELISLILSALCGKGKKILTAEPDFSMYRFYASLCELNVKTVKRDEAGRLSVSRVLDACEKEKPGLLIFSNPCNPTGQGMTKAETMEIMARCGCIIVIDEAYMDFWDETIAGEVVNAQNGIVLRTCSKAAGLAGVRLGFAVANPSLISLLNRARSPYNLSFFAQAAGETVLRDREYVRTLTARIRQEKERLEAALAALSREHPGAFSVVPTVTNFCLVKTANAEEIFHALLVQGIAVRLFSGAGLLRVSTGTESENDLFLSAFSKCIAKEWGTP